MELSLNSAQLKRFEFQTSTKFSVSSNHLESFASIGVVTFGAILTFFAAECY